MTFISISSWHDVSDSIYTYHWGSLPLAFGWRDVKLLFLQKRGQAPLNKKILQTKKYSKLKNLKSNPTCLNPSGQPARPTLPPSPQKPEGFFWYRIWISVSISKNNRGDLGHIVGSLMPGTISTNSHTCSISHSHSLQFLSLTCSVSPLFCSATTIIGSQHLCVSSLVCFFFLSFLFV